MISRKPQCCVIADIRDINFSSMSSYGRTAELHIGNFNIKIDDIFVIKHTCFVDAMWPFHIRPKLQCFIFYNDIFNVRLYFCRCTNSVKMFMDTWHAKLVLLKAKFYYFHSKQKCK